MNVLIVDDSGFIRRMLRDILEKSGYEIVGEAADGEQAVRSYSELRPSLVTMDITMPVADGIQALERIMELDPDAAVVMVSALNQEDFIERSLELGAKDFIVKPFQPQKVLDTLERVTRG